MQKVLALLLLAVLPLTPSWAGVAVDCSSGTVVAQAAPPMDDDGGDIGPACCGEAEVRETQCGSDCSNCHGLGITAITGIPVAVGVVAPARGESDHACPALEPVASGTFRPPSARFA